jgi:undecaprenyl-diphosphatase
LGLAIALGTLPIVLAGMALKIGFPGYENSPLRSVSAIAIVSIVMALLLAVAEVVGSRRRQLEGVKLRDGLLVGLAQALALVPGVSRSGSTLTASLFDGWDRAAAARFSFLLGIPAITLAGLVELKDALHQSANGGVVPTLVGVVAAAVVSWLAIAWLLRFLQRNSTWIFVGYRLLFGLVLLIWFRGIEAPLP